MSAWNALNLAHLLYYYWSAFQFLIKVYDPIERNIEHGPIVGGFLSWRFGVDMPIVAVKYALLYLTIFMVSTLVGRFRAYNALLNTSGRTGHRLT